MLLLQMVNMIPYNPNLNQQVYRRHKVTNMRYHVVRWNIVRRSWVVTLLIV